jgi:hypothetical protein
MLDLVLYRAHPLGLRNTNENSRPSSQNLQHANHSSVSNYIPGFVFGSLFIVHQRPMIRTPQHISLPAGRRYHNECGSQRSPSCSLNFSPNKARNKLNNEHLNRYPLTTLWDLNAAQFGDVSHMRQECEASPAKLR